MRWCSGCRRELPVGMFHKDRSKKSGYQSKCKACAKSYMLEYSRKPAIRGSRVPYATTYRNNPKNKHRKSVLATKNNQRPAVRKRNTISSRRHRWLHPNRNRARAERRRAAKLSRLYEPYSNEECHADCGGVCYLCDEAVSLEEMQQDHVIPVASGGDWSRANLRATHPRCNAAKGAKHLGDYLIYRVMRGQSIPQRFLGLMFKIAKDMGMRGTIDKPG